MKRLYVIVVIVFALCCAVVIGTIRNIAQIQRPVATGGYQIADLGVFPGYGSSTANAINNKGQIVGQCMRQFEGPFLGFLYENGKMKRLATPDPADESVATDINENGWIVGSCGKTIHLGQPRATLWKLGEPYLLNAGPTTELVDANAINNHGQIVGRGCNEAGEPFAYLWQSGKLSWRHGIGGGEDTAADDINESGTIVSSAGAAEAQAYVFREGHSTRLPGLGGSSETANAVNDKGDAVGIAFTPSRKAHACLWRDGKIQDLGLLDGNESSQAYDINNLGQIVGSSYNGKAPPRAVLWMNGRMYDLNTLLPRKSGWTLHDANGINDRGQIVGEGVHNGKVRAFLLTPR